MGRDARVGAVAARGTRELQQVARLRQLRPAARRAGFAVDDEVDPQLNLIKGLKLRLVSVGATKVDGDKAIVRATIATGGQRAKRRFELAKEGGDWKLVGGS